MSPCKPGRHLQGLIFIGMDSDRTAAPPRRYQCDFSAERPQRCFLPGGDGFVRVGIGSDGTGCRDRRKTEIFRAWECFHEHAFHRLAL